LPGPVGERASRSFLAASKGFAIAACPAAPVVDQEYEQGDIGRGRDGFPISAARF